MLKLRSSNANGRSMVWFGLSRKNCERLLQGKPIVIFGEELGITVDVTIFAGETEAAMVEKLEAAGFPLPESTKPGEKQ